MNLDELLSSVKKIGDLCKINGNNDCLDMEIANFDISNKLFYCLKRKNINTIGDLFNISYKDLSYNNSFGKKTAKELYEFLEKLSGNEQKHPGVMHTDTVEYYKLYNIRLDELPHEEIDTDLLPTRLKTTLEKTNIRYVNELFEKNDKFFNELPGYGSKTHMELHKFLKGYSCKTITVDTATLKTKIERISNSYPKIRIIDLITIFDTLNKTKFKEECFQEDSPSSFFGRYLNTHNFLSPAFIKLVDWCEQPLSNAFDVFLKTIDNRTKEILQLRLIDKKSLEETGILFDVTRERTRQIEAKGVKKIIDWIEKQKIIERLFVFCSANFFIEKSIVKQVINSNGDLLFECAKKIENNKYKYEDDLEVIIDKQNMFGEIKYSLNKMPPLFFQDEYEKHTNELIKNGFSKEECKFVINKIYYKQGTLYHKEKLNKSDLYLLILKKWFPDGMQIYNENELARFKKIAQNELHLDIAELSSRSISAILGRVGALIGRGAYVAPEFAPMISEELSHEIYNYISASENPVFLTNTIFSIFEDELRREKIDNKYRLQSALREKYEGEWYFRRDYISKDSAYTNIYSSVMEFIKNSKEPVDKSMIFDKYPAIPEIVVNTIVASDEILNLFGVYIHVDNLKLKQEDVEYIEKEIKEAIDRNGYCNAAILYEIAQKEKQTLLKDNFIIYPFSFFSLCQYLFEEDFEFNRPYISCKGTKIDKPEDQIFKIFTDDIVEIQDILDYLKKSGVKINNQLDLINSFNADYFLLNDHSIAKIECLGLKEEIIEEIDKLINISQNTNMPIAHLECFDKLPKINVNWTDWLLYSVIKKWSKKFYSYSSNTQFRFAFPVISSIENDSTIVKYQDVQKFEIYNNSKTQFRGKDEEFIECDDDF